MLQIPKYKVPIVELKTNFDIQIFVKREDLVHPKISGNKFWKLFNNVNCYLESKPVNPLLITYGGAFSNHIAAVSAFGKEFGIETLGIIRGEELQGNWQHNPTLLKAYENNMRFHFVSREEYRDQKKITDLFLTKYPNSLVIPEGGSNNLAIQGINNMLGEDTKDFDYLCTAVGTGGTVAGISKYAMENQKVLGILVVNDDSLEQKISNWSGNINFELIPAGENRYGKVSDDNVNFINWFFDNYDIPLDPIYTGKMMQTIFGLAEKNYFPKNSKVLALHTGGLQGIKGTNQLLKSKKRNLIHYENLFSKF